MRVSRHIIVAVASFLTVLGVWWISGAELFSRGEETGFAYFWAIFFAGAAYGFSWLEENYPL